MRQPAVLKLPEPVHQPKPMPALAGLAPDQLERGAAQAVPPDGEKPAGLTALVAEPADFVRAA